MNWSTQEPAAPTATDPTAQATRPRSRGVRLTDLDRDELWVIGHTGRRWETLGTLQAVLQAVAGGGLDADASRGAARTAPAPSVVAQAILRNAATLSTEKPRPHSG